MPVARKPLRAIRAHCVDCCGGGYGINGPAGCNSPNCAIFPLRCGEKVTGKKALKLIRKRCLECVGGVRVEVVNCTDHDCDLYSFRFGTNPSLSGLTNTGQFRPRRADVKSPEMRLD